MKRLVTIFASVVLFFQMSAQADEGMWLLTLLNKSYDDMKAQGFKLTPQDIYDVNKSSMKDAIAIFGRGCTSEIISDKGLLLTNHHCGYDAIQSQSTVEHNYLEHGFWAMSLEEELPNPGLKATFLIKIEDVTAQVLKKVTDKMTESEREAEIKRASEVIITTQTQGTHYSGRVAKFFEGNEYYLFINEVYTDVRLVGTPPESIGKFGHDTDNWVWPRHTGDFSIFRVYSAPDGKPADYSPNNIPLKPKYHLPISLGGVQKGDFAMVLGYPGSTDRYLTSWGIEETMNITNQNRIHIRGIKQEIMLEDMQADEKVRIQYASKYARSSNYWKYSIGQNKGLKALNVKAKKQDIEAEFTAWINADKKRQKTYGEALSLIEHAYANRGDYVNSRQYIAECFIYGSEIFSFAYRMHKNFYNPTTFQNEGINFYKDYNPSTDQKITKALLKLYRDEIKSDFYPTIYQTIDNDYNGNIDEFVDAVFSQSIFANQTNFDNFAANLDQATLDKDIAYTTAVSIFDKLEEIKNNSAVFDNDLQEGRRLFMAGLREMKPSVNFYPDANFTMRLTYGTVGDYSPADAVHYDYYTTMKGIMQKEDPNNWEFFVDPKLKELYQKKDFGPYADKNGEMWVCFTTNNDITGGNSGSPVINGSGELIGCAFDGNWEAMSGDIAFEPELQKTICVDIRYVLFVIDKFAGAKHLVDEMTLKN